MKKITIVLVSVVMFSYANASSIGMNSVGFKLGSHELGIDTTVSGVNADVSGSAFAYEISGNYNLLSPKGEQSFGIDASLRYMASSDMSIDGDDAEITYFEGGLRPYLSISDFILFGDLGFSYVELEVTSGGVSASVSETAFAPGFGFQVNSEKFNVRPTLHWVEYNDDDTVISTLDEFVFLTIPVSYNYSDTIDVSFSYRHAFGVELTVGTTTQEVYTNEYTIGLDYKF